MDTFPDLSSMAIPIILGYDGSHKLGRNPYDSWGPAAYRENMRLRLSHHQRSIPPHAIRRRKAGSFGCTFRRSREATAMPMRITPSGQCRPDDASRSQRLNKICATSTDCLPGPLHGNGPQYSLSMWYSTTNNSWDDCVSEHAGMTPPKLIGPGSARTVKFALPDCNDGAGRRKRQCTKSKSRR